MVYCGFKDPDGAKFNLKIGLAVFVKCLLAILCERGTCDGYAFVFDMQGFTISHLASFTISLAQKFLYFAQVKWYTLLVKEKRAFTFCYTNFLCQINANLKL